MMPNGSVDPWHILGITIPGVQNCDQSDTTIRFMNGTGMFASHVVGKI